MTMRAYQEMYLHNAQAVLGDAFDYAVNICHFSGEDFIKMFVVSTVSTKIANGEPAYTKGKSGLEVLMEIVQETTGRAINIVPVERFSRSPEYWIGWAIAYYQWFSCRKFSEIFKVLSFAELKNLYYTLHEADISKFVEIIDARLRAYYTETRLKSFRLLHKLSQSELAKLSGVSLRSIQMYEQHKKNINKASAETVLRLAKVLNCDMTDLLEV